MTSPRHLSPIVRALAAIRGWSSMTVWLTIAGLIALVVGLEVVSGHDITVAQLFLVPVLFAAARSWRAALAVSIGANVIGCCVDLWRLLPTTSVLVPAWNWSIRGASAAVFAWLLKEMFGAFEQEHSNARTDALTGAVNRLAFRERLSKHVEAARRTGRALSLVYIDLDKFKSVNDQAGHDEGDRVLRAVVETIAGKLRERDAVFRLGGDEFAFVLVDAHAAQAAAVSERILGAWAERAARERWPVGLSIGVTTLQAGSTVDTLLEEADQTMYRAKREGGGRVLIVERAPPGAG